MALPAKALCALGDVGTVLGVDDALPPGNGTPPESLRPFICDVADGVKTDLLTLPPPEFRQQLAFTATLATGQINSAGDILFTTLSLEGPEDAPAWEWKTLLWTPSTSSSSAGTLAQIPNPGTKLNATA